MNFFQKLATFLLRLFGTCWAALLSVMWLVYFSEAVLGISVEHYPTHTIIGNMAYIAIGLVAALAAKPIGKLLGRGLD